MATSFVSYVIEPLTQRRRGYGQLQDGSTHKTPASSSRQQKVATLKSLNLLEANQDLHASCTAFVLSFEPCFFVMGERTTLYLGKCRTRPIKHRCAATAALSRQVLWDHLEGCPPPLRDTVQQARG